MTLVSNVYAKFPLIQRLKIIQGFNYMWLYSKVFLYIFINEKFVHGQMDSNADMIPIRLVEFREAL